LLAITPHIHTIHNIDIVTAFYDNISLRYADGAIAGPGRQLSMLASLLPIHWPAIDVRPQYMALADDIGQPQAGCQLASC